MSGEASDHFRVFVLLGAHKKNFMFISRQPTRLSHFNICAFPTHTSVVTGLSGQTWQTFFCTLFGRDLAATHTLNTLIVQEEHNAMYIFGAILEFCWSSCGAHSQKHGVFLMRRATSSYHGFSPFNFQPRLLVAHVT